MSDIDLLQIIGWALVLVMGILCVTEARD